jgi:uncharacterized membrane protein
MQAFRSFVVAATMSVSCWARSQSAPVVPDTSISNPGTQSVQPFELYHRHWTFTSINFPGALQTSSSAALWGINAEGDIVGAYNGSDGNVHGILRAENGVMASIDVPGATFTYANSINACRDIVGGYTSDPTFRVLHSYLLSSGQFITIDFPGAAFSAAFGNNCRGQVVGAYKSADGNRHGYLLSGGQYTSIDLPGAVFTSAQGISGRGDIVGFYSADGKLFHGFFRKVLRRESIEDESSSAASEFISLDFPGATFTRASGINRLGDIVGDYTDAAGMEHGYLFRRGEFISIDFPNAIFTRAYGINARGEIVGDYKSADGQFHGFLLSKDDEGNSAERSQ